MDSRRAITNPGEPVTSLVALALAGTTASLQNSPCWPCPAHLGKGQTAERGYPEARVAWVKMVSSEPWDSGVAVLPQLTQ